MEKEQKTLLSTQAAQSNICTDAASIACDDTDSIAGCSSNFSSFNLHIPACSSPYAETISNSAEQPNCAFQKHNTNSNCIFLDKLKDRDTILDAQQFAANKLSNLVLLLDKRLIALLVSFVSIIILYKMVIVAMPYANSESLIDLRKIAEARFNDVIIWAKEHNIKSIFQPLFCGLALAIFACSIVYLDSNIPGINPPSPFSPHKNLHYYQRRSSIHLGYLTAIATGLIIGIFMYFGI